MQPQSQLNFNTLEGVKVKPRFELSTAIVGIIFLLIVAAIIGGGVSKSILGAIVALIVSAFPAMYFIVWYNKQHERSITQLNEFASINGFTYMQVGALDGKEKGTIFTHGNYKTVKNVLNGTYSGLPFRTFFYQYTVGHGRYRFDYDLQVAEFTLPRSLPHMVIDSLVEHNDFKTSTLPIVFDKSQKIELEGDFHKYFALYAPDSYGVSALTILAPDAMEALMKHAALCDIEIIDNKLYFYWPIPASTKQGFEQIFSTTEGVLTQIQKKLETSDIYAHASQAQIHASAASSGVRLKRNKWTGIFAIMLIVGYSSLRISAETLPPQITAVLGLSLLGAMIVSAVYLRIKSMKKKKLRAELRSRSYN